MPLNFRCYTDPGGNDVIRDWYHARDGQARGQIAGVIWALEENPHARCDKNLLKELEKKSTSKHCEGFWEILIDYVDKDGINMKHHYRIVGYFEEDSFIMLSSFYKNVDSRYAIPCQLAVARRVEIALDRQRTRDCEFPSA